MTPESTTWEEKLRAWFGDANGELTGSVKTMEGFIRGIECEAEKRGYEAGKK